MSFPGFQKAELGRQMAELGCQMAELGCQKAELDCHNTKVNMLSLLTPEVEPMLSEFNIFFHASSTSYKRWNG